MDLIKLVLPRPTQGLEPGIKATKRTGGRLAGASCNDHFESGEGPALFGKRSPRGYGKRRHYELRSFLTAVVIMITPWNGNFEPRAIERAQYGEAFLVLGDGTRNGASP